jgi:5-methylcytosine-specific restriction enzyme subunit McrC
VRLVPQAPRRLTSKIPIRPDLVLRAEDQDLAVADVKYKELKPDAWPYADLYQLLAYCVSLNLPSGLLIYASGRSYEEHIVEGAGVSLGIIGVEMSGSPRDLEARVRRAARHLVRQAARRRSMQTMVV